MIVIILCCLTVACSNNETTKVNIDDAAGENMKLTPSNTIASKETLEESAYTGSFENDFYIATVDTDNDEMTFTIVTKNRTDGTGYEWVMKGFFSEENTRVNYTDGVKSVITYDSSGNEKKRQIEYDYGSGRMQFTDSDHLVWNNSTEFLEGDKNLSRK